jgi:DNA-binding protein H-NS
MAKQSLAGMSLEALVELRDRVTERISKMALAMRSELEGKLARINGYQPTAKRGRNGNGKTHALKGRKVAAKYRSKKDPKLTWAGRGATPRWMRDEMKEGKLKKDAFLIK